MDQQFINQMQERLEQERIRLEAKLESGSGEFTNIGDDEEENVQEVETYDQSVAATRAFNDELGEVVAALQRIEQGTYGVCTQCGQAIGEARLEAFPAAMLCMTCAKQ